MRHNTLLRHLVQEEACTLSPACTRVGEVHHMQIAEEDDRTLPRHLHPHLVLVEAVCSQRRKLREDGKEAVAPAE